MTALAPIFPTAHEIATAIIAAASLHQEDPIATLQGAHDRRGRYLAFAALIEAFPSVQRYKLAGFCGFGKSSTKASSNLTLARKWAWWRDSDLGTVKAALAAEIAKTDRPAPVVAKAVEAAPAEIVAPPIDVPRPPLITRPPRIFDRTIGAADPDLTVRTPTTADIALTIARRKRAVPLPPSTYGDPDETYIARRAEAEARGKREKAGVGI